MIFKFLLANEKNTQLHTIPICFYFGCFGGSFNIYQLPTSHGFIGGFFYGQGSLQMREGSLPHTSLVPMFTIPH